MRSPFDIVGFDMPCVDLNVNTDVFPRPNGGMGMRQMSWQGGGKVATGLVAAARMGARCAIFGAVGDDLYGRYAREDFVRHGVDTECLLARAGATTSFSLVISDAQTRGRSIVYHAGTAESLTQNEIPHDLITSARWLFVSNLCDTAFAAARTARDAGVRVLLDADYYTDALPDFIPLTDAFVASAFVYEALFCGKDREESCRDVRRRGPAIVVFTDGDKGCFGLDETGDYFTLPAYSVPVRDTVGAGDVFHGAFAAGMAGGLGIVESARLGSAAAAIKCTRIGGRAGIPNRAAAEKFLSGEPVDYAEIDARAAFYERGIEHV
jgi:sulfofructose kinase